MPLSKAQQERGTAAPRIKRKDSTRFCPGDTRATCKRTAGQGTDHPGWGRCAVHRGNTQRGVREAAVAEARSRCSTFGIELAIDPFDALRAELGRTNGMIAWAKTMCDLIITQKTDSPQDLIKDFRFLAYKQLLDEERDRLVRIARASLDSNLQERKQMLSEALAEIVVDAFHGMIRAIPDMTPNQIEAAREIITLELTERAGEMIYAKP